MSIEMLTEQFFIENPLKEVSAQRLIYSSMYYEGFEEKTSAYTRTLTNRAEAQRAQLEKEESPEVLFDMMRGKCDIINHMLLIQKILEHEEVLLPQIINSLKTSLNDVFVELAVKTIKKAKNNYCDQLLEILDDIRSPYAVSLVCIVIGFLGNEDAIPVLLKKHKELKAYKNENYEQGPLLGLYQMDDRFNQDE
jgi:hypothetical protein